MIDMNGIELGDEVECVITGFKGIATGVMQYINACGRILVQPKTGKDGKHPEGMWMDTLQLKVKKKSVFKRTQNGESKPDKEARGGPSERTQRGGI